MNSTNNLDKLTPEEALIKLKLAQDNGDFEIAHGNADDILCALLNHLGYPEIVKEFLLVPKWYA